MRLHRLTITAFGPFPGTEEIDFDGLSAAGLFLVHGPTGAGKTSVLDAVCFALYGQVPGVRQHAKALHSDHAPRDRAPRVELEFTIRGRRLRVRRSPEWSRPKRRGTGETREHASVTVEELADGAWSPLTTRLDEAGQLISGRMGMSAEQFCQVALLPQGEFARFLRAGAEDRRTVLERLFATEVYAGVEAWLADRRTSTGRTSDALRRDATGVADRVAEVAGDLKIAPPEEPAQLELGEPEPPRADERPDDPERLPAWAALLETAARDALASAESELTAATARAGQARAAADTARAVADRRRRHADATARAAALSARAGERASLAATIDAAHRASRVRPLIDAADQRAKAYEEALNTATHALATVTPFTDIPPETLTVTPPATTTPNAAGGRDAGAGDGHGAAGLGDGADSGGGCEPGAGAGRGAAGLGAGARGRPDQGAGDRGGAGDECAPGGAWAEMAGPLLEVLERAEQERRDDAARLDGLRGEAARLRDVREQGRTAAGELERLDAEETRVAAALADLPGTCAELERARDAARERGAAVTGIDAAIEAAEARLAAATRRDDLRDRLVRARAEAVAATDTAQSRRDDLQRVREARIAGMAAELATGLTGGEPCPVCGAAEHPAPAHPADDAPAPDAERAAEERYETARLAREAAEKQAAEVATALEAAADQAGDRTVADATADLDAHRHARTQAVEARTEADRLDARFRATTAELDTARARATEIATAAAELRTRTTALSTEADRIAAILDAARGTDPTIESRADRLTTEATALRTATEAITRARTAHHELRTAHHTAAQAAENAGFTPESPEAIRDGETPPAGAVRDEGTPVTVGAARGRGASVPGEAPVGVGRVNPVAEGAARGRAGVGGGRVAAADVGRGGAVTVGVRGGGRGVSGDSAAERGGAAARAGDAGAAVLTGDARDAALIAAVRRALLAEDALAALVERRRVLDAEDAAVRELLADPELVDAAAQDAPDLASVEAALAAATDARTDAASARDHARGRHARLGELAAELDDRVAQWRPAARHHAVAARLAALTSGTAADNRDHMKLSAYVLAARLEQVVDAANARLARMSAGRYVLEHTTDRAKGDRRVAGGGLGLRVVDTWTMRPREPATLSGGETFLCSLALALGLADVVTAEAGGAEIATLFVDEGFGSLDADTLDEVMDVLDDLRDGGRAVGVVSHVAELRARITAHLMISKGRAGSTLAAAV